MMIAAVSLAGVAYVSWPKVSVEDQASEGDVPGAVSAGQPVAITVPFLVKAKVNLIMEQQRRIASARSHGDIQAAEVRIRLAARDIRERLLSDGIHDEAAMQAVVRAAAAEVGFNGQQTSALVSAFSSANANKSGSKGGLFGAMQEVILEIHSR